MSSERKAVVGLLLLAAAGHGVRLLLVPPGEAPGAIEIVGAVPGDALLARRDSLLTLSRPLQQGERINLDRARAEEIARLPGVGMGLAKRIVAERGSGGPFGSLEGLDRVRGVGPGLLAKLGGNVTFDAASGKPGVSGRPGTKPADVYPPVSPASPDLPGVPVPVSPILPATPDLLYVLNHGDLQALDRLPGIGLARARRIVAFRDSAGSFTSIRDLERVPGLSRASVHRLATGSTGAP